MVFLKLFLNGTVDGSFIGYEFQLIVMAKTFIPKRRTLEWGSSPRIISMIFVSCFFFFFSVESV